MRKLSLYLLLGAVTFLAGCAQMDNYHSKASSWMFGKNAEEQKAEAEARRKAMRSQYALLPMPELMSNESVIVYPLEGDISNRRQNFMPEQNAENMMGGGHVVFDPSVQVYAVDGPEQRPSYLPEYAVPLYESQNKVNASRVNPSLTSSNMQPRLKPREIRSAPLAPIKRSPKGTPGRRSAPVLTGY